MRLDTAKYREILEEKAFQAARVLRLGRRFTFPQEDRETTTLSIPPKLQWFRTRRVNVLEWHSQRTDRHLIENAYWQDLKGAVHQQPPCNPVGRSLSNVSKKNRQKYQDPDVQS